MDSDNFVLVLILLLLLPLATWTGYKHGRNLERKSWTKFLPEEFEKTCLECAGLTK